MKQAENNVDRTGWEPGPWDQESDREDFTHAGFACFINRNHHGVWCGYVGVPKNHPDYEKDYDSLDVNVHGGLTYANKCQGDLCHVAPEGYPDDVYWFGFDCHHGFDYAPGFAAQMKMVAKRNPALKEIEDRRSEREKTYPEYMRTTYKTQEFAKRETEHLAEQLSQRWDV